MRPVCFLPVCLLIGVALLAATAALAADEVRLIDGRVLEGEITSPPDAEVVNLRITSGGMSVTQHFPRHQIASITYGVSPRQQEAAAIGKARAELGEGGDAAAWDALVERARELGDNVLARDLAAEVIQRDRHHAEARNLLGHVRHRGVWMRIHETHLAQGLAFHQGRAMTWDERETVLAKADAVRQAAEDRRTQREEDRRRRAIQAASIEAMAHTPDPWGMARQPTTYRAVYWPPVCTPVLPILRPGGSTIRINAGGGGSGFRWDFSWNTGGR